MGFKQKSTLERLKSRKAALDNLRARCEEQRQSSKAKKRAARARITGAIPDTAVASFVDDSRHVHTQTSPVSLVDPRLRTADGTASLHLTPWARKLAMDLVRCSRDQSISLRLVWPAEIDTVVTLHAIASLGTILDSNLKGLRTLFYPGTDTTWATLDRITTDRDQYEALRTDFLNNATPTIDDDSVRAMLTACQWASYAKDVPLLRIRQLVPAFRYDRATDKWIGLRELPIDALIKRLPKKAMREQLRLRIEPSWTDVCKAPGALLVLHRELTKKGIKSALAGGRGGTRISFDAVLMDASTRTILARPAAVRSIPKHIATIQEAAGRGVGVLIVTNDPAEYGLLAKNLERAGWQVDKEVLASEGIGTDWLASSVEFKAAWTPEPRGIVNFKVRATDEQAARLARRIRRIADSVRHEGPDVEEPFLRAQQLIQRASLIPGGICDALADGESTGWSSLAAQLDLAHIEKLIQEVFARGGATTQRKQIAKMIEMVRNHLDACSESTPLAEQLRAQIERFVVRKGEDIAIVIFSARDVAISQQYLARVLGQEWTAAQRRVQWLTLTEALTELTARTTGQRLIIVGLNPRMLRFLATQKEVPLRTSLLIPSHQAARMLPQLRFLSMVDVLKPYRGRLVELKSRLEGCLRSLPDIDSLVRIYDTRLPATAYQSPDSGTSDPSTYKLYLDDGRCVSVSGNVFRYEGMDDSKFHRVAIKDIREGDAVFEMSDELREEVEVVLSTQFSGFQFSQFRSPLDGYRAMLNQAIEAKFPGASIADRIPALQAAMASLSPNGEEPSDYKLRYWLNARNDADDTAPHFPREKVEYMAFCKALLIPEPLAEQFWLIIRKVRTDNQGVGKQMASVYTEVLLAPESSKIYRNIKPETIQMLQSKALDCVAQVVRIDPPEVVKGASTW